MPPEGVGSAVGRRILDEVAGEVGAQLRRDRKRAVAGVVAGIEMGDPHDGNFGAQRRERGAELAMRVVAIPIIVAQNARIVRVLLVRLVRIGPRRHAPAPASRDRAIAVGNWARRTGPPPGRHARAAGGLGRRVTGIPDRALPIRQVYLIPLRAGAGGRRQAATPAGCGLASMLGISGLNVSAAAPRPRLRPVGGAAALTSRETGPALLMVSIHRVRDRVQALSHKTGLQIAQRTMDAALLYLQSLLRNF